MGLSDNLRGALFMIASMASFTVNDAFMKSLAGDLPLFQALFLRGVATSALLIGLAAMLGKLHLRQSGRDWRAIGLRCLGEVGAGYFFVTALFHMPLGNVSAVLQSLPLTVTLAGALFLGEGIGWRRLVAILVGFVGVMLILRPGPAGFDPYAIYAVCAVGCVTLRDIATRFISREVPSLTVACAAAVAVTGFSGIGTVLVEEWAPLSPFSLAMLAGGTIAIIGGYLFSVLTMRAGEIAFIAPFRYTSLVCALILGFGVFGEWPDALTALGAAIVVAMGLFTFWREQRLGRSRRANTPIAPQR